MEVWKDIKGYEGVYQVSNLGRVKSLDRTTRSGHRLQGKLLVQTPTTNGYLKVNLSKDRTAQTFDVHRLVAEAFIENPKFLPQVNHKDENKKNNCANNLEWCTPSYNMRYATRNDRAYATWKRNVLQRISTDELIKELQERAAI